jgi:peptidoglycan hydrolase-like protein with peptidoglycan-binding domain
MTRRIIKRGSKGLAVQLWQNFLLMNGYSIGLADGNFGRNTEIGTKDFQKKKGLKTDGVVGPKTWSFVPQNFKPILVNENTKSNNASDDIKPNDSKIIWPKQDYNSMVNFYGAPGENQIRLEIPYKLKLAWEPNTELSSFTCHKKVANSIYLIFEKTLKSYGIREIQKLKLDIFGGCLNVRRVRGGSSWSIHSWGAAIDLDPNRNQLKWGRDKATFAQKEYDEFWKIVENEGWVSLGRSRNYDWMHFQAATL